MNMIKLDYSRERMTGIRIAKKAGAEETVKLIKDTSKGFADIFAFAAKEIGKQALIKNILDGPPLWSQMALLYLHDFGPAEEALRQRAAEAPAELLRPAAGSVIPVKAKAAVSGNIMGPLSLMALHNAMAATCEWTVEWMNNGVEQPGTAYPDWNDWLWSEQLTAGCSSGPISLTKFAAKVPKAPLGTGDTVWIYIWVMAGTDRSSKDSLFQFTYNSGSAKTAYWNISGTTTINQLSLTDYK